MAGVLGVATGAYLPYCFFNLLSPLISLIYGFTGFRIEHVPPTSEPGAGDERRPESALEGGAA
jgi:NhaC family Na+:H+ antiporter